MKRFEIGDRVRLTGAFLRNTGQTAGGEGRSQWIVLGCTCPLCKDGRFVLTNELSALDAYTEEELKAEPQLKYRHINARNLELVKPYTRVKYHMCPECEASFKSTSLVDGKFPPHAFCRKPCPGSDTTITD